MKKRLFILISAIFCVAFLSSCFHLPVPEIDTSSDEGKESLNASIIIDGTEYPSADGRGFSADFPTEETLDEKGRVVKGVDYILYSGVKTLVEGFSEYEYNENDIVINRKKYDTCGNLSAEYRYTIDETSQKPSVTEVFDKDGNMTGKTVYTYERVLCSNIPPWYDMLEKTVSTYDADGKLTEVCEYEYFDTIRATYPQKATYYDGEGKITKIFEFDVSGDYEYLYVYENGEFVEKKTIG